LKVKNDNEQIMNLRIIAIETRAKYLEASKELRKNILLAKQKLNILNITEQDIRTEQPIKPMTEDF